MSQFTVYMSTDVGAPVVDGTSGSLTGLLTACLVTGYGTQIAAGWSLAYTGAPGPNGGHRAAYKMGTGTIGYYMQIRDDSPDASATSPQSRIAGFESMTGVDDGAGRFPLASQGILGTGVLIIRKSLTTGTTARPWVVVADSRTVYGFIATDSTSPTNVTYTPFYFGEFYSYVTPIDPYRCLLVANPSINTSAGAIASDLMAGVNGAVNGHYLSRTYAGLGGPNNCGKHGQGWNNSASTSTYLLFGNIPFANGADQSIIVSPVYLSEPNASIANGIRGKMRGFWHFCHAVSAVSHLDTFSGVGNLAGKTFMIIKGGPGQSSFTTPNSIYCIETSNTLDTN